MPKEKTTTRNEPFVDSEKTFETVDHKVAETEFFLQRMCAVKFGLQEFNWYFSAFLSAARTTTLALQQFRDIPGFEEWYEPHRKRLSSSELAKFFLDTRNEHVHGGEYPVSGASYHGRKAEYFFGKRHSVKDKPFISEDVVTVSRRHLVMLLEVILDCYVCLGVYIDPQQYYTKEHFASLGSDIEVAEAEIWGFIRTSLIEEGYTEDDRWHDLRSKVGECEINHLFYSYLGKTTPQPIVPDHYHDFEFTPEEKGWEHIPAGFSSLDDYRKFAGLPIIEA